MAEKPRRSPEQELLSAVLDLIPIELCRLIRPAELTALYDRCQRLSELGIKPAHLHYLNPPKPSDLGKH